MKRNILCLVCLIVLVSCKTADNKNSSYRIPYVHTENSGSYYAVCTFFPENSHMMFFAGVGYVFDSRDLQINSLEVFKESFYEQTVYTPLIMSVSYWSMFRCLGYNTDNWDEYYNEHYYFEDKVKELRLKLNDGNYVIVKLYRINPDMTFKYLEDYKECIGPSSIEIPVSNIASVDKAAIIVKKQHE